MTGLGTFWRTVRHLKARQILGRVRFRLLRPVPDLRPPPALRASSGPWALPARRAQSFEAPGSFRFLNEQHPLAEVGWDSPAIEKLWRYNLHYFDDLQAEGSARRAPAHRALMAQWILQNRPGTGTGWEPYPTSLRIVNWIKWFVGGASAEPDWLHSLAVQVRWLHGRLEWHLLGNHLFANAKALVFAGLFFAGREADDWLAKGLSILEFELEEQILPDGGQFERSPMYHALALEDVLDLLDIIAARAGAGGQVRRFEAALRGHAPRMLGWLRAMSHPDATLGLFNDTANGIAPPNTELERLAAALHVQAEVPPSDGVTRLDASGYVRVAGGDAVALLDVAPIGPDYLPGHAHADTLCFELSLGGRRVLVNRGTSCYGHSERRLAERGTAAHSTVQVAKENSSEVWSGFRVGRRARPQGLQVADGEIACAHDGYRHLPGAPEHRRHWRFGHRSLSVQDTVSNAAPALARYHLAPGLQLQQVAQDTWQVSAGGKPLVQATVEAGCAHAKEWLHAAGFGVLLPAQTLEVALDQGRALVHWNW
jgi:uncharacterized heparinase superfamily protein